MTNRTHLAAIALLLTSGAAAHALSYTDPNYANVVVTSSGLGTNSLYNNPDALLGQPDTQYLDPFDGSGGNPAVYDNSMVAAAFNTDASGNDVLVSLGSSGNGTETVEFTTPIVHSNAHWYGDDFIVFGNSFFSVTGNSAAITPSVNMNDVYLGSGIYQNGIPTVSVSADNINWVTLTSTNSLGGGAYDPTNAYAWDTQTNSFGSLNDFTKPVNPALTLADFTGQSVAYADNALYNGSAGGAAFTLAGSGLTSISYIRFTGTGNLDAVARVSDSSAAPEPSSVSLLAMFALGLFGLIIRRRFSEMEGLRP